MCFFPARYDGFVNTRLSFLPFVCRPPSRRVVARRALPLMDPEAFTVPASVCFLSPARVEHAGALEHRQPNYRIERLPLAGRRLVGQSFSSPLCVARKLLTCAKDGPVIKISLEFFFAWRRSAVLRSRSSPIILFFSPWGPLTSCCSEDW